MWLFLIITFKCCLLAVLGVSSNHSNKGDHWGYGDHNGPSEWASSYPSCGGNHQSPVNIITSDVMHTWVPLYSFHNYDQHIQQIQLTNTGHSVNVEVLTNEKPYITGGGLRDDYILQQFHFHWGSTSSQGSEHYIDSTRYPMEIHNVFYKASYGSFENSVSHSDGIAVLAVFLTVSPDDNTQLNHIVNLLPEVQQPEMKVVGTVDLNLKDLLPVASHSFYWYRGSFTTPGCDEVVTWTVFKDPITISEAQLDVFRNLEDWESMPIQDNFRPTQSLNDRLVYTSTVEENNI